MKASKMGKAETAYSGLAIARESGITTFILAETQRQAGEWVSGVFKKIYLFYLFIFGCVGSSLLRMGFL